MSCYVEPHCNQKTILCDVEETTCTTNSFVALRRLHATAVDCAYELINWNKWDGIKSGIKGNLAKFSKINKRGVLNKVEEG